MNMHFYLYLRQVCSWRKACIVLLAFALCGGLIFGVRFAAFAGDSFFPMMRAAANSRVSIVGLVTVAILPFLFSAFAVYYSQPWLLLPIAFCKAFSFGYSASLICGAFGSAGWLVSILLMFSDGCMLPVLCWFWLRHIPGKRAAMVKDLAVCTAFAIFIGMIDYCCVSPYLAMLIDI